MYSRTQNDNGTYNTRCLDCFMTIASAVETEQELYRREARHFCPERALSELFKEEMRREEETLNENHPHLMHG
jgi:hypothetical protein